MNSNPIKYYVVDAFTDRPFSGNPAAVVPLDQWKEDSWLQNVAMEMNLAETAFYVRNLDGYDLRWFTPKTEVDLCGHATLASAFVLTHLGKLADGDEVAGDGVLASLHLEDGPAVHGLELPRVVGELPLEGAQVPERDLHVGVGVDRYRGQDRDQDAQPRVQRASRARQVHRGVGRPARERATKGRART